MPDQPASDGNLPTLEGEIARVQAGLAKARAAGVPMEVLELVERELAMLQRVKSEGSVFLRGKTQDGGVILGLNLPPASHKPGS
jgi:hypothetical protein